jgi:hypothetical protein
MNTTNLAAFGTTTITAALAFAVHPDNDAVAILTLPPGHGHPLTEDPADISGMEEAAGNPAYRLTLDPRKLAAIADATETQGAIVMEFPAEAGAPVRLLATDGTLIGWAMPAPAPAGSTEGLLITPATTGTGKGKPANPAKRKPEAGDKPLPPPAIIASVKRGTLEIAFGGVPPEEIRTFLKSPDLGFRYSGRGTKRGVPANQWYAPHNPHTEAKIREMFPSSTITQAA